VAPRLGIGAINWRQSCRLVRFRKVTSRQTDCKFRIVEFCFRTALGLDERGCPSALSHVERSQPCTAVALANLTNGHVERRTLCGQNVKRTIRTIGRLYESVKTLKPLMRKPCPHMNSRNDPSTMPSEMKRRHWCYRTVPYKSQQVRLRRMPYTKYDRHSSAFGQSAS
jgi:hypothetical protein